MAQVLISGASGLIGKKLTALLLEKGHTVKHLGRKENLNSKTPCYKWDLDRGEIDERAFENIDTVVHLAGAGIADEKWTTARKKEIIDSRVISSKLLAKEINKRGNQIKTFVGASAVGFYGAITNEKVYYETDAACTDFMGSVCKQWEESYNNINKNTRLNIIRIGVVLSKDGGALPKLAKTIRMGIGSALGSGQQYMPWIHIDDLVGLFYEAITNENMHGIYNGVAPIHANNKELSKAIAQTLHKPFFMPSVPKFILKLILGEMAVIVLEGVKVSAEKTKGIPFTYKHPELKGALQDLLMK